MKGAPRFARSWRSTVGPGLLLALILVVPAGAGPSTSLTVFAAASLTAAFSDVGDALEQRHPGLRVRFNFAGSQQLVLQIEHGAHAGVLATADEQWMASAQRRGLLVGPARIFARNRLVVIVPRDNPGRIDGLQDLARAGTKVVLAAENVPVGRYSRQALARLAAAAGFGPRYEDNVLRNVVSHEESVKGVVAKVQLGEADAGIVYHSDVTSPLAGKLRRIDIPEPFNVTASYPIGLLKHAANPRGAQTFVDFVLSPLGQRLLQNHHLIPIRAAAG